MACTNEKYSCPSSVNVTNFATLGPELGDEAADPEIQLQSHETSMTVEETACQGSEDFRNYLPLYNAALRGDWKTANVSFFQKNKAEIQAFITENKETALHVAVRNRRAIVFVQNLVQLMQPEDLAIRNCYGNTALHEAAIVGNTEAARIMVNRNPALLYIRADAYDPNSMALDYAATNGQKETLEYLIFVSKHNFDNTCFKGKRGLFLLFAIICQEFMDVALDLVHQYPDLARSGEPIITSIKREPRLGEPVITSKRREPVIISKERELRLGEPMITSKRKEPMVNKCALSVMAQMKSVFASRQSFSWWENFIYHCVPVKQSEWRPTGDIEATTYRSSFPIINRAGKRCKSMIWKVMEHLVPGVKDIKAKKKLHRQALELVKYLCREMKSLPTEDSWDMLKDSIMCAAKYGINEIVEVIMEMYPALTTCVDVNKMTIMHVAVSGRFENVFNLIYKMIDRKHMFFNRMDNENNSLLHLCARLPDPERLNIVTGAALQMQRELQWFNEMEKLVPPSRRMFQNADGKTAKVLFTEEHQDLREKGERWMKDTANACSIAAALIATVVFAASFTVPGGVSSETGKPILFEEPAFVLFATTNAVSLFTSITSLLLFLSILTSRYAEQDFLYVLPKRLSFGLLTLFISITFMLVAFSAALYLLFRAKLVWFIIPVTTFGWLPVASFVRLQFPLLVDVLYSTYGPGIIGPGISARVCDLA